MVRDRAPDFMGHAPHDFDRLFIVERGDFVGALVAELGP
jgi:hypothetical protein